MARELVELMPRLGDVKILRQWAGPYDVSPDGNPIVGELPGVPGFYLVCGFVGHGFMMAPVVARHYAAHLAGDAPHAFFSAWRAALRRRPRPAPAARTCSYGWHGDLLSPGARICRALARSEAPGRPLLSRFGFLTRRE